MGGSTWRHARGRRSSLVDEIERANRARYWRTWVDPGHGHRPSRRPHQWRALVTPNRSFLGSLLHPPKHCWTINASAPGNNVRIAWGSNPFCDRAFLRPSPHESAVCLLDHTGWLRNTPIRASVPPHRPTGAPVWPPTIAIYQCARPSLLRFSDF